MQCSSNKLLTATAGILAYSHTVPCWEMSSMEDSLNIMISDKKNIADTINHSLKIL